VLPVHSPFGYLPAAMAISQIRSSGRQGERFKDKTGVLIVKLTSFRLVWITVSFGPETAKGTETSI
jgi:hypothetical protein